MRVMVLFKAMEGEAPDMTPTPERLEAFAAMDRFTEALVQAGIFVAAAGLKPAAESRRIAVDGASRTVKGGPFDYGVPQVVGFSIWQVSDMDEAVSWARRCPNPMAGPSEIEIRPFYEAADLTGLVTPDAQATPRDAERGTLGVA
jgi:hypothetical protein